MPNRVPAVRCIKARHPSMGTSLSSTGVSWRTLWGIQVTHAIAPAHYLLPRPSIRADSARNAVELTLCQLSRFNSVSPKSENVWPIGSKLKAEKSTFNVSIDDLFTKIGI